MWIELEPMSIAARRSGAAPAVPPSRTPAAAGTSGASAPAGKVRGWTTISVVTPPILDPERRPQWAACAVTSSSYPAPPGDVAEFRSRSAGGAPFVRDPVPAVEPERGAARPCRRRDAVGPQP